MTAAWVVAGEVGGRLEAEILKGMLESLGLHVQLSHESVASVYSLGIGPVGRVELLVPAEEASAARAALDDYFTGKGVDTEGAQHPPDD
jgi:Putative prokaryotic signal transducing protein